MSSSSSLIVKSKGTQYSVVSSFRNKLKNSKKYLFWELKYELYLFHFLYVQNAIGQFSCNLTIFISSKVFLNNCIKTHMFICDCNFCISAFQCGSPLKLVSNVICQRLKRLLTPYCYGIYMVITTIHRWEDNIIK